MGPRARQIRKPRRRLTTERGVADTVAWLIDGARSAATPETILGELCDRLVADGLPLWRSAVFVRTLHPLVMGRRVEWRADAGVTIGEARFDLLDSPFFRDSPVARVYERAQPLRLRLDDPATEGFPHLDDLRTGGATDYLAFPLIFTNSEVHVATWATRRRGGFSERHRAALAAVNAPLARITEIFALRRTAANLLDTYVGNDAGARILAGHIRRGSIETIHAAIWFSDMRGFTALADSLTPPALIELLNRYFDCQVPAILAHGGEVLKFMGDGLLAIFPLAGERSAAEICRAALAAARQVRAAVAALDDRPPPEVSPGPRYGLALHVGELLYGNIGAANRLDFTCIGPAVNLAARLEGLARDLGRTTLFSAQFARHCGSAVVSLGKFPLAGFRAPQPVYGLADEG